MPFDEVLEEDFGPVRLASKEEIQQEHLQRKTRKNNGKIHGSVHGATSKSDILEHSIPEGKTPQKESLEASPKVEPKESPQQAKPASKKKKLVLSGHDELLQYLEEKKRKKLTKQQQKSAKKETETPQSTENAPKRRKLMFVPMDESHRQKILAKSIKQEKQVQTIEISDHGSEEEPIAGPQATSPSESSDVEFEDASDAFQDSGNDPRTPTTIGVPVLDTQSLIGDSVQDENLQGEISQENNDQEEDSSDGQVDLGTNQEENINLDIGQEEDIHVQDKTAHSTQDKVTETIDLTEEDVGTMRRLILAQVNGNTPLKMEKSSLYQAYKDIYSIFSHTIHGSESHTALLTGAPGTGKTEVVEQALAKLDEENHGKFITIRLSGSLHSSDQHAIREIARQLDVKLKEFTEDTGEDDTYEQRAISDTFHNILSALFKLDESAEPKSKDESPIRVIFIIDEIDKFTGNPKQTLLYNLFELSQASKVPICIVGITPKVTIREHFEKRVRSRFSQRMIQTKKADTMETFWLNSKISLTVPEEKFDDFCNKEYPKLWNEKIETLFRSRSGLTRTVFRTYYTTKNYRQINNESALAINRISKNSPFPKSEDFEAYSKNATRGVEAAIASLSATELIVVVAAARWIAKSELPQVNFKLAFKEYTEMMKAMNTEATTLSSKTSYIDNMSLAAIKITMKTHSPAVLRGCWRVVYRTGLLFDVISSNSEVNANNNLNMYKETMLDDFKMLQLDVSLEELAKLIPEDNFVRRFTRL